MNDYEYQERVRRAKQWHPGESHRQHVERMRREIAQADLDDLCSPPRPGGRATRSTTRHQPQKSGAVRCKRSTGTDTLAMRSHDIARTDAIKLGADAGRCRYKYRTHMFLRDDADKEALAHQAIGRCCDELGAAKAPAIRWLEDAGPGYTPAAGCDQPLNGFHDNGTIYVHKDLHGQELIKVVAHEVFHAVRHRNQKTFTPGDEQAAIDYGRKVADDWPDAGLRVHGEAEAHGLSA